MRYLYFWHPILQLNLQLNVATASGPPSWSGKMDTLEQRNDHVMAVSVLTKIWILRITYVKRALVDMSCIARFQTACGCDL